MTEPAATPLDRLIAALARKAVADHLASAAPRPDDRESNAHTQEDSPQRAAA